MPFFSCVLPGTFPLPGGNHLGMKIRYPAERSNRGKESGKKQFYDWMFFFFFFSLLRDKGWSDGVGESACALGLQGHLPEESLSADVRHRLNMQIYDDAAGLYFREIYLKSTRKATIRFLI